MSAQSFPASGTITGALSSLLSSRGLALSGPEAATVRSRIEGGATMLNGLTNGQLTEIDRLQSLYNRTMAGHHTYEEFEAVIPSRRVGIQHDPIEPFVRDQAAGRTFWDVGANIGYFSLAAARQSQLVRAFEPESRNAKLLDHNVALNDFDAVETHDLAISATNGTADLYRGTGDGCGRHALTADADLDGTTQTVNTRTVDSLAEKYEVPGFVKVDVEGAEGQVLRGATDTLDTGQVDWLIEVHSPRTGNRRDRLGQHGDDAATVYECLDSNGYTVYGVVDGEVVPFDLDDETLPLQWYATVES